MTDILSRAGSLRGARTPFVLATVVAALPPQSVRPGTRAIVHADGTIEGWIGGGCVRPLILQEAREALADGAPRLVRMNPGGEGTDPRPGVRVYAMTCQGEGGVEIFLEPVRPAPRVIVLGETPVASAVARLASELDFDVVQASPAHPVSAGSPGAGTTDVAALRDADASSFVVVATMGAGDEEALAAAAGSGAGYVGLVASAKKARFLVEYARSAGVSAEALERVKAPAGLDLGGMTPAEIALSILAEIVQRRHAARVTSAPTVTRASGVSVPVVADVVAPVEKGRMDGDLPRDPICGMPVDPATARHTVVEGSRTVYFCCPHCRADYLQARGAERGA